MQVLAHCKEPVKAVIVSSAGGSIHLAALDALRGLAVLGVLLLHGGVLPFGWVGVNLFFVLSGYLITGILLDAKDTGASWRAILVPFYARRSLRILPLAWLTVALVAAATHQWSGAGWYAAYLVNWLPNPPEPRALGHFWTLAVEEQFYLIWPLVILACSRPMAVLATFGIIGAACASRAAFLHWDTAFAYAHVFYNSTLTRADPLAAGALLALLGKSVAGARRPALGVFAASGVAVILSFILKERGILTKTVDVLQYAMLAIAFTAGVLLVVQSPPRWLQTRWLVWLGTVSYGVYVIHGVALPWLNAHVESPAIRTALMMLSIPLAALSWRYFEAPILALKRRWPMPRSEGDFHSSPPNPVCRS